MRYTLILLILLCSCSVGRRLQYHNASPGVTHPSKKVQTDSSYIPPMKVEFRGDSVFLVETQKVDGEDIPTVQAATVTVASSVRNVAERNGRVNIEFDITVPTVMQGNAREIILSPIIRKTSDSILLDPICLRGETIDLLQSRESWQLDTYLRHRGYDSTFLSMAYDRFVHFPLLLTARLDTVIHHRTKTVYHYRQTLPCTEISRKMKLIVPGQVIALDGSIYSIPTLDTLSYLVSSMTAFVDTTTRHKIKIVDRNEVVEEKYHLIFPTGKSEIVATLADNTRQIEQIENFKVHIMELSEMEIDSILISASCSPEGSYKTNEILSRKRSLSVADSLFNGFPIKTTHNPENWEGLKDSLRHYHLFSILSLIETTSNPDEREMRIVKSYPHEYKFLRQKIYPSLRVVSIRCHMHRRGMIKDTIHLQQIDTAYMDALADLQNRRYAKALSTLSSYRDRNTAIALMSLGYDKQAMDIIARETESDSQQYLLAILCSRLGLITEGRSHYLRACTLNSGLEFRGNLDPEIDKLLQQ